MGETLIKSWTAEPVSVEEAKNHLRVTASTEDTRIEALIGASRDYAESYTRRAFATRTLDITFDSFPEVIELPHPPLRKVVSISYIDPDGQTQTLASSLYSVKNLNHLYSTGRIRPAYGETWPSTRAQDDAVTVRIIVGYVTPFTFDQTTDVIEAKGHPFSDGDVTRLTFSGAEGQALPNGLERHKDYYIRDVSGDSFKLAETEGGAAVDITGAPVTMSYYAGELPDAIRHAILTATAHYFNNREDVITGTIATKIPNASEFLLFPYKVPEFG